MTTIWAACSTGRRGEMFTYKDVPTELFHKDARFEKQQESSEGLHVGL